MKKTVKKETREKKLSLIEEYSSFLKLSLKTYDPPCLVLNLIALVLFSFGLWYRDLVNVIIAVGFWLLCHIYTFVSTRVFN